MLPNRILYCFLLAGMAALWLFYDSWLSVTLFFLTLALPPVVWLFSLPFARDPEILLEMPPAVQRGEDTVIRVSVLTRGRPCPLPGNLRIFLTDRMGEEKTVHRLRTPPAGSIPFSAQHCGIWHAEIRRAVLYDFLGLFSFRPQIPETGRIAVMPKPTPPSKLPDLGGLAAASYRPKPGGGFSEIHELREYRPGDPLRSVHWKVSAKTDDLIVREAEEAIARRALVSYALPQDRDGIDRVLDRLVWVSDLLLSREIPHRIVSRNGGESAPIEVRSDLDALVARILSAPADGDGKASLPAADWHYRLDDTTL